MVAIMELKTTLATAILNGMTRDFLLLSEDTKTLSLRDFAYGLLFALNENLGKQGLIEAKEVEEMQYEMKLHLMTHLHIDTRAKEGTECNLSTESKQVH